MFKMRSNLIKGLIICSVMIMTVLCEQAQSQERYPNRPIDIVVPFKPGGGVDSTARVIAPFLSKKLGVPINILNKPGANTLAASVEVFDAAPNGYTFLADCTSSSSVLGVVVKDIPFKIMDRTFIAMMVSTPGGLMVPAASPWKSLDDLKAEAKRDPGGFTWASFGGAGSPDHITRQFLKTIGVDVLKTKPVMGTGGAEMAALLAGGHVKFGAGNIVSAKGAIEANLIRLLATTTVRDPNFPNVPTTAELGYPAINYLGWIGFSGPPKVPSPISDMWNKALKEVLTYPECIAQFKRIGFVPFYKNAREMREYIMKETEEATELYGLKKK